MQFDQGLWLDGLSTQVSMYVKPSGTLESDKPGAFEHGGVII